MSPRKVAKRSKQKKKRKSNRAELFLEHFGNENYANFWRAESVARPIRRLILFTGLRCYASTLAGEECSGSSLKEVMIFFIVEALPALNWIFLLMTTVTELNENAHEALKLIPLVLTGGLLLMKGIVFCLWKKKFQKFVRDIMSQWNRQLKCGLDDAVASNVKRTILTLKMWFGVAIVAVIVLIIYPLYLIVHHAADGNYFDVKILPTQYPFVVDNVTKYILCNLWEAHTVMHFVIAWVVTDASFIYLSSLLSLKLQVLGIEFRKVVQPNDIPGRDHRPTKRVCKAVREHAGLLQHCRTLDELYSPIILAIVVYAAACMSIDLINIQEELLKGNVTDAPIYVFNFCGVTLQAALYCDSTENISHWTGNISQEIYDCDWTARSIKFKKLIIMIMMRAQNNYIFKAYGFYVINRAQLAKIVMLTFNLFNVIRAVKAA